MAKKYLSLERLTEYDALIKEKIDAGDESILESAKSYTDEKIEAIPSQVQADWNQNDPEALDYVKNRPFYTSSNGVEKTVVEETSVEIYDDTCAGIIGLLPLEKGKIYTVVFNGTTYECTAWYNADDEAIMLGNGDVYGGNDENGNVGGNGEPFSIDYYDESECYLNVQNEGTYTISVSTLDFEIIKINEKYLPDRIAKTAGLMTSDKGEIFNSYGTNIASARNSHAEGCFTTASGESAHAEGMETTASGQHSHAEGSNTKATSTGSHAEGVKATASGYAAHAEGYETEASGNYSHAEGEGTVANEDYSHAEGRETTASGSAAHAEGYKAEASGNYSHAEGQGTTASGENAHAEGDGTTASEWGSHAEGQGTTASARHSHAEGYFTTASGESAHAEGDTTIASGSAAHAEGMWTRATGYISHAEGFNTRANGDYSHAEGEGTIANGYVQHVQGAFNVEDSDERYLHIVGNGSLDEDDEPKPSNAHTLDWEGNAWFAGNVYVGGDNQDNGNKLVTEDEMQVAIGNIATGGITVSKAESAEKAEKDANGNVITATYETKVDAQAKLDEAKSYTDGKISDVNTSITNITNGSVVVKEAEHATNADSATTANSANTANSATKATQDGSGNVITSTYETKTDATAKLDEAKSYTDTKVTGMATTTVVDNKISAHNTSTEAHSDIRDLISALSTKVNNFLDVDDTTTDQLSEVLTLIENNKGTLESLTSNKVNVSDIVDNLTTANASKVLSANQGVVLKGLIDALQEAVDKKSEEGHKHAISDVTNLQSTLDAKALQSDLDALELVVNGKSDEGHGHAISDVTGLQNALDGKSVVGHKHTVSEITDLTATAAELNYMDGVTSNVQTQLNALTTAVDGKANATHSHAISDVSGLQDALDSKAVKSDFDNHTSNTTKHITAAERTAWNAAEGNAKTYTDGQVATVSGNLTTHVNNADIHFTAAERTKLSGIADGANKTIVDSALSATSENPVANKAVNSAITTLTSIVSTNTDSITALQEVVEGIQEITSEEISALFAN